MSKSMYMFDDINVGQMPAGAYAYAGYVDGRWPTYNALKSTFPGAHLLSITVFGNDAEACDVETGDMTNAQVYAWFLRQKARQVYRPCVYTSASNAGAMQATMQANGFTRSSYRLWTAHYTDSPHFCAPNTCGYGLDQADATQFTSTALGRSLDESVVSDGFFQVPAIAENPVSGLNVTRRGFTSVDLAWNPSHEATGYSVHTYWRGAEVENQPTADTSIRVRNLKPVHTYTFRVRAHPGGSTGTDASVKATTR